MSRRRLNRTAGSKSTRKVTVETGSTGKKYEFTGAHKLVNGVIVRRIRAASDFYALRTYEDAKKNREDEPEYFEFRKIKKGTLGGWVESEDNLSQECFCWVDDEACVYGEARVTEGALVYDNAQVFGHSTSIGGLARVFGNAKIRGDEKSGGNVNIINHALVFGNARITSGWVCDTAKVYGDAVLCGCGTIFINENAKIHGHACIAGNDGTHNLSVTIEGDADIRGWAKVCHSGSGYIRITGGIVDEEAKILDGTFMYGGYVGGKVEISYSEIHDGTKILGQAPIDYGSETYDSDDEDDDPDVDADYYC